MILYPAIDLKGGACVRLVHGEMESAIVFNQDLPAQAREFAQSGFTWLHVVDLDGAFAGQSVNRAAVEAILSAVDLKIQLGGGLRDIASVSAWLEAGVSRIILGTAAVKNPALVREAASVFPGRIAVGIDAKGGRVAVEGWSKQSDLTAIELARRLEDAGVAVLIHTDIERDGTMQGLNVAATAALARAVDLPVIASGGLSSLDDIKKLKDARVPGIVGAISGRALYDGRLDARAALALMAA